LNTDSKSSPISVVILFGPTAVGKTELIFELFAGRAEIVNADSMQVYRGVDIGTAKPTTLLRKRIPHHLIDVREPEEGYSVGAFVRDADSAIAEIEARGRLSVVSGGSAFYLRNFIYGLPETPRGDRATRRKLVEECDERGLEVLRSELEQVDPSTAERLAPADRYRILRALEVYRSTGRPLSSFNLPTTPRSQYRLLVIGLERPRIALYERIDDRVEEMMKLGLEGEVRRLVDSGHSFSAPAMKAIGYREFEAYFAGERSRAETIELIKRNSRRYAKRQITFFKQLPGVVWFSPESRSVIGGQIERFLNG